MNRSVSAEVKAVLAFGEGASPDVSLEKYEPSDPDHFGFSAQVFIGDTGSPERDSFDVTVCSPSWFADQVVARGLEHFRRGPRGFPDAVHPGAGLWFMRRWDRAQFEDALNVVCEASSPGPDWGSVASRIGRLIPWEFDYKYDQHVDHHPGPAFPA